MSGKGSAPRPKSVEDDVFSANWSAIFGGEAQDEYERYERLRESGYAQLREAHELFMRVARKEAK